MRTFNRLTGSFCTTPSKPATSALATWLQFANAFSDARRWGGGRIKGGRRGRGGDRSSEKARREVAATMEDKKQAWPETPAVAKDSAAGICLSISVSVRLDVSMSVSVSTATFRVCI